MRIIGLDLALTAAHKALIADAQGQPLGPIRTLRTIATDLAEFVRQARHGMAPAEELWLIMEPTGMAWFPVAVWAQQHGVTPYLVNTQQVADLRRYYHKHAKSDRIDVRVLVKLPVVSPEQLHPLRLPSGASFACQRGVKELETLMTLQIALQQRICAIDQFAWPGLELVCGEPFAPHMRWFREQWYQPQRVLAAGASTLQAAWHTAATATAVPNADSAWVAALVRLAEQTLALYGTAAPCLDYEHLQAEVTRHQALLAAVEMQHHTLKLKTVRPLYRRLHPQRQLETLKGVGQDSAAVYLSFIGDPQRFPDHRHFRSWTGMIPGSRQSGTHQAQSVPITQAGPALVKKFAYLDAETARQWDPQMAALYYDQMVKHGKHHSQAVCCCATHLLDRVWTILKEGRAYELRDVDGTPVTVAQAREIIAQRYRVPKEVRQHNNRRNRHQRSERRAERQQERESRTRLVQGKS
jgi:transposase